MDVLIELAHSGRWKLGVDFGVSREIVHKHLRRQAEQGPVDLLRGIGFLMKQRWMLGQRQRVVVGPLQ